MLARLDPAFYAAHKLRGPAAAPYYGKFLISEHHERWSEIIRTQQFACIQSARGSGKTFFFNLAYLLWQAERNPGFEQDNYGIVFSGSERQAQRILSDVKVEIEQNPKLAHLLPQNRQRNWGVEMIQLANGHRIYSRGWGSKTRGNHPKYIVCDDVLNDEDATSALVRLKNIDYFLSAVKPMLDRPDAQLLVIGTPYHKQDLYGYLEQNPEFFFARFPAIKDDGTPQWPEKFPLEALQREQRLQGKVRFAREYLCTPVSEGASLFPLGLFRNGTAEVPQVSLGWPRKRWDAELPGRIRSVFMGVDFAISKNVGADYTAIFVIGLDKHGNRWIMDIERGHGMDFMDQLGLIQSMANKYEPDLIGVENNQMQRIFEGELIRTTDLPIIGLHTGREKSALENGIPYIATLLENGKYRIPRGDPSSIERTDLWISEMHSFTFDKGKVISIAEHDDTAMACFVAEKAAKAGHFSIGFGDTDEDAAAYDATIAEDIAKAVSAHDYREMLSDLRRPGAVDEYGPIPQTDHDGPQTRKGILVDREEMTAADRRRGQILRPADGLAPTHEVLDPGGVPSLQDILLGKWRR